MARVDIWRATILGVGTGDGFAASMGPMGYALGLGTWFGIFRAKRGRSRRD